MPIAVQDFHNDIRGLLRENGAAFVSPEAIDYAINKASIDVLQEIIREHEDTSIRFMADQSFLKKHSFSGTATVRALPSDVFKVSSVFIGTNEGDLLSDKQFNDRLNSVIIPPSTTRPIATIYSNADAPTIEILPSSDSHIIKYWKNPVKCSYKYTITNGEVVYNATGSVDIDFPQSEYTRLFNRTMTYLGPTSKDADVAQLEQNILR